MSDQETFDTHQDGLPSDYDYGMGSGRPADEGKGLVPGSEHDHHPSKMKKVLGDVASYI